MKLYNPKIKSAALSYAGVLEKVEIFRSTLRWAPRLERPEIQKLLDQCNSLRDEIMQLSHRERFVAASAAKPAAASASEAERRQALLERSFVFEGVFGENPKLLEALEVAEKAAPTDLPVLIDGESGTGKELMAKVIHANGNRADKPYISVNCGAIPENLLESELFGHKKGAFTGATGDRKGKFESAHGGSIFLDEIGEMPLLSQVKLLRVLQSNEIQRVGSDQIIEVDARVVAATNKNLRQLSREGGFREDLFYRLDVIHVTVPSLRERADEIPLLCEYFCDEAAERMNRTPVKMTGRLTDFILHYRYPGNIRELRNIIYRLTCLAGDTADLEHLPEDIRPETSATTATSTVTESASVSKVQLSNGALGEYKKAASDQAEKEFLQQGLREVGGSVAELARRIEMNRSHLQTVLKKHGLQSRDFRPRTH
ncbi:MAG: sigma 54-interacting transcriptional regulator [Exilibacterium sp.]